MIMNFLKSDEEATGKALTDLSFLDKDKTWPPESQKKRLTRYKRNEELFDSEQAEVYKAQFARIQSYLDDKSHNIYPVIINFNKLLSIKTADLIASDPPEITSKKKIDSLKEDLSVQLLLYEICIDVSRYGDAVARVYKKQNGKSTAMLVSPDMWFPIVSLDNKKEIVCHCLGWTTKVKDKDKLNIQLHYRGYYEKRIYSMNGNTITGIDSNERILTGLSDFAVQHFNNVTTSKSIFGHDDYYAIDSILSEIMVRFTQIDRILDKHANPSMQGPSTALETDEAGNAYVAAGNYFITDEEGNKVSYITWDGNLDSNFKQIDKLIDLLYTLSEMGAALLGVPDSAGRAASGTTMRLRMVNPLIKAKRLASLISPVLKKTLSLCSEIGYERIDPSDLTIVFKDGLPNDDGEMAETAGKLYTANATSIKTNVEYINPDWDETKVLEEEKRIMKERGILVDNPDDLL